VPNDRRRAGARPLEWFNALPREAALQQLLAICSSRRWAEAMVDARPFDDLAHLQETADSVWLSLGPEDWLQALEGHPRIGEKGGSAEDHSRQEQAGMQQASVDVRDAIADGNRRYEERFGHVFLIAASGREPHEILANLTRRLDNNPEDELRIAAQEHRRITRLRLDRMLA
jgi:2-oxo-4-hydroxy-4-carboxy-5-ureidoimidazoline decarboxylase